MSGSIMHYLIKTATYGCGTKRYVGTKGTRIMYLVNCEECLKIVNEEIEKMRAKEIVRYIDLSKPIIKDDKGMYKNV